MLCHVIASYYITNRFVAHTTVPCGEHIKFLHTPHYIIITSGKNFIKITSVGMGAAKSNETR